jgi:hypothetical protein
MLYYSNGLRSAQNNALIAYAGTNAVMRLYTGTQPASANDPITTQTLLVSLPIVGVFGTDSNGVLTLGNVSPSIVVANGTATFFRFTKSDGTTVLLDGSVGTSGADLILNKVLLYPLMTVTITAGTIIRNNI